MDEELAAYLDILKSEVSNLYNQRLVLQARLTVSEKKRTELETMCKTYEDKLLSLEVKLAKKKPNIKEADSF